MAGQVVCSGGKLPGTLRRLLTVSSVTWITVATVAGGFTTFQFLDRFRVGRLILQGHLPYRDFALEYPPGAAVILTLPAIGTSRGAYDLVFRLLMLLAWGACALLVLRRMQPFFPRFLAASLVLAWMIGAGFDVVVALAVGTAWLSFRRKPIQATSAVAAGVLVKLTPFVLVPLLLRSTRRRRSIITLIILATLAVSVAVPYAIAVPGDDPLTFHAERPIHAESLVGSAIAIKRVQTGQPYPIVARANQRAIAESSRWAVVLSVSLLGLALAVLWIAGDPTQASTWFASLLAIPALGPVGSPQFLLWPLALSGLVSRGTFRAYLLAGLLSWLMFGGVLIHSEGTVLLWLTLLRNIMVLAALGIALRSAVTHDSKT